MKRIDTVLIAITAMLLLAANKPRGQHWSFEEARTGALPAGWRSAQTGTGTGSLWKVLEDKSAPVGHKVLAQTSSKGPNRFFNLCVAQKTRYKDLELVVSFKANTGQFDRGGGPVWRYQDANNYYVCRQNPLEDNFCLYKVIAGRRSLLGSLDVKAKVGRWHTIRVVMRGNRIICSVDGRKLDVRDASITKAGQIGLWTKADAVTSFDNVRVTAK